MYIPVRIKQIVKNIKPTTDDVGKSSDVVLLYSKKYVLKISTDIDRLEREYQKATWLYGKLPTSKPLMFIKGKKKAYYLKEYLKGKPLFSKEFLKNPSILIDYIVEANQLLDSIKDCPFKSLDSIGNDFVHGDLCLPNILILNNKVSGFIDLENSGVGDKWLDYAWLLWSLQRNIHSSKYNNELLTKLNITFDKDKFDLYISSELQEIIKNY